jgi:surface protein
MTHLILAFLQIVLIPDLAKIVYAFVPDIECEYADGSTRCFKNGGIVNFSDVVHITVFTEFIITKDTKFKLLVDITGPVKLVGDMSRKFAGCTSFNSNTDLWDTSKCTNMSWMFSGCRSFNQPLDSFDTAQCTDMAWMFEGCALFDQSLRGFDTAQCTDMSGMFCGCELFNPQCGLDSFDTAQCTDMKWMLKGCVSFNQSLRGFDTSNCTNMNDMFT